MKIIRPQFEIWAQEPGIRGVYRQVERAGRVCYKSESHQTEFSAEPFVQRMIASQHTAMLEHATVYLQAPAGGELQKYATEDHSRLHSDGQQDYVTTNLRVLVQRGWMDDLQLLVEPTPRHERRVTVHFTTQIAITREFNRHRVNSMAEQSTRYCNYGKDKFGNEISVNLPTWLAEEGVTEETATARRLQDFCRELADNDGKTDWNDVDLWLFANLAAEYTYMQLISRGRKPQEARVVLPLDTNTELVHTAFVSDWKHFFDLRALGTTGAPHPDAKAVALPLMEEFKKLGLIKE